MFKPILSGFTKYERKFVCIKPHLFDDFIKTLKLDSKIKITQFYVGDTKYRNYNDEVYTKHSVVSNDGITKDVDIKEITSNEYLNALVGNPIKKDRYTYLLDDGLYLNIDRFHGVYSKVLIEIWSREKGLCESFNTPKFLLEVTGNKYYSNKYIFINDDNFLTRPLYIIEGTDLIGKTTLVKELVAKGYYSWDRDQYRFSGHVQLNESLSGMKASIEASYRGMDNYKLIALLTHDTNMLESRLAERGNDISEYDKDCVDYNDIYIGLCSILNLASLTKVYVDSSSKVSDILASIGVVPPKTVYIASKFNISGENDLSNDFRVNLLGNVNKLIYANESSYLLDNVKYIGPFYCEESSKGIYTSTSCKDIVNKELKAVELCDYFIVCFDDRYSCGSVVELTYACSLHKNVLIVYRIEDNIGYKTKSEHWFAIQSALQLNRGKTKIRGVVSYSDFPRVILDYIEEVSLCQS